MDTKTTPPVTQEQRDFSAELTAIRDKAGRLGLWKTMHALQAATDAVGWELAEIMGGKPKRPRKRRR